MLAEQKWKHRWLHFYKSIACVGIIALAMPIFEVLCRWSAGQYAGIVAPIAVPFTVFVGYAIQYLCLGKAKPALYTTILDFTYENKKAVIPWKNRIVAWTVTVLLTAGMGRLLASLLVHLLGVDMNRTFGQPMLILLCIGCGIIGCLLVPFRFHQLLTVRTLVECVCAFSIVFGFHIWVGNGATPLLYASLMLYALCLSVLLNQEYVIKPSTLSKTCHAGNEMRFAGIVSAVRLWGLGVLLQIPLLGAISLVVTPFLWFGFLDTERPFEQIFIFPFINYPTFNVVLFFTSLLAFFVGLILFLTHYRNGEIKQWIRQGFAWIQNMWERFLKWLAGFRGGKDTYIPKLFEEPKPKHYVDTVTKIAISGGMEKNLDFRTFQKRLKTIESVNEKYCYAYRVLLANLYLSKIGIQPHHTPLEVVDIVKDKTNVQDFDSLTDVFLNAIYAREKQVTEENLKAVCKILRMRLA